MNCIKIGLPGKLGVNSIDINYGPKMGPKWARNGKLKIGRLAGRGRHILTGRIVPKNGPKTGPWRARSQISSELLGHPLCIIQGDSRLV